MSDKQMVEMIKQISETNYVVYEINLLYGTKEIWSSHKELKTAKSVRNMRLTNQAKWVSNNWTCIVVKETIEVVEF